MTQTNSKRLAADREDPAGGKATLLRVLVAPTGPGSRQDDFSYTTPGELVRFGIICDSRVTCGCDRSLVGLQSRKSTTTFEVAEREMTMAEYVDQLRLCLRQFWRTHATEDELTEWAAEDAHELIRMATELPVGVTLRYRHPLVGQSV